MHFSSSFYLYVMHYLYVWLFHQDYSTRIICNFSTTFTFKYFRFLFILLTVFTHGCMVEKNFFCFEGLLACLKQCFLTTSYFFLMPACLKWQFMKSERHIRRNFFRAPVIHSQHCQILDKIWQTMSPI